MQSFQARLQGAPGLPDLLAASFDTFEAIRQEADSRVDEVPELFAAFLTTSVTAVEGREAVTAAPSLPPGPAGPQPSLLPPGAGLNESIDTLCDLGALLDRCLTQAAATATLARDRAACEEAADAARQIRHLMARDDDATGIR
jgi:hypothetical protein